MELVIDNCNDDELNKNVKTVIREKNPKYYANFSAFLCQHSVIYTFPIVGILMLLSYALALFIHRDSDQLFAIAMSLLIFPICAMFFFIGAAIWFYKAYYRSYLKPAIEIFPEIGVCFGSSMPRWVYNETVGFHGSNVWQRLKSGIVPWKKIEKFELLHASQMPKSNCLFGRNDMCIVVYINLKYQYIPLQPVFVHFAAFEHADGNEIYENMVKYHSNWIKQQGTSDTVTKDQDADIPVSIKDENGNLINEIEVITPNPLECYCG